VFGHESGFVARYQGGKALQMGLVQRLRPAYRHADSVKGNWEVASHAFEDLKARASGHHVVLGVHLKPMPSGPIGKNVV
jgi:hypothetical protein